MSVTVHHICGHTTEDVILRVGNRPPPAGYVEVSADKPCPKCQQTEKKERSARESTKT
jgi:hypothetical protein